MTVFSTLQGTQLTEWRIGLTGPTIYSGSADPTVPPPTPLADGFGDGDVYLRTGTGAAAIWVIDGGVWTQIASGATGGTFAGDITMIPSAQFLGDAAASAGAPSYSFDGDTDTGMFQNNPNEISFATGGIERFIIEGDGTLASTTAGYESLVLADNDIPNRKYVEDTFVNGAGDSMTGDLSFGAGTQVFLATGTALDPSAAFTGDPDTGMYLDAANTIGFSAGGSKVAEVGPGGLTMATGTQFIGAVGAVGTPSFTFTGDTDSGLYSNGSDSIGVTLGGVLVNEFVPQGFRTIAGTVALPSYSFTGDTDTGMYNSTGDEISFTAGGTNSLVLDTDSVVVSPGRTLMLPDGAANLPAINFVADSDTGIFRDTNDTLGIATNGAKVAEFDEDQLLLVDGAVGAPAFGFITDEDTGMYLASPGNLGLTVDGTLRLLMNSTGASIDGTILGDLGSAANPTFSFSADDDTGMYQDGANDLGFATAGMARWEINQDGHFRPQANNTYDIGSSGLRVATVYATTFDGTATAAQYSDLAERYTVGDCCSLEPGDVVVICEHEDHDICLSENEGDTSVLGVVSTAPAFMMNKDAGDDESAPYIALRGRVPVKVIGDVKKGDLLIVSNEVGHARALQDWEKSIVEFTHSVFAKALASHDNEHGDGIVEAVIL